MLVGYMRVSKVDGSQVLDLQRDALLAAGVDATYPHKDHASGKRDDRPGLEACLKAVRSGDTLVAWKLDRLGRDLRHLVNLMGDITRCGIGLRVLAGEGRDRRHDRQRPARVRLLCGVGRLWGVCDDAEWPGFGPEAACGPRPGRSA